MAIRAAGANQHLLFTASAVDHALSVSDPLTEFVVRAVSSDAWDDLDRLSVKLIGLYPFGKSSK